MLILKDIPSTKWQPIIDLFEEMDHSTVSVTKSRTAITLSTDVSNIYLRIFKGSIDIASIKINRVREGYGTKILNELKVLALEYQLSAVTVESTFSLDSICWCEKNGFNKIAPEDKNCYFSKELATIGGDLPAGSYVGDWILNLSN